MPGRPREGEGSGGGGSQALLLTPWRCGGRKVPQEPHSLGTFLGGTGHGGPASRRCEGPESRRKGRAESPWPWVTLAGEPLPAIGGFALAQAVPQLLGVEAPGQQHGLGEVKQAPEAWVPLSGQSQRASAGPTLQGSGGEGAEPPRGCSALQ